MRVYIPIRVIRINIPRIAVRQTLMRRVIASGLLVDIACAYITRDRRFEELLEPRGGRGFPNVLYSEDARDLWLGKKKNWRFGIFLMADDACVCVLGVLNASAKERYAAARMSFECREFCISK